ncbi:TlpA family protein disulfide reductase [Desulfurobacterium atlanticum]|uniref:Thioredoxin-like n=1 Tax=Desulfurobacterium atlanticum TaxID=240169 RepID=A0A238YW23_9BACT|nr:redoxin domain-containing protein [Desulfurobacterium atlanticum]SNR74679.1 Thioredoxin-like [Desulfurobacterium atlanticum]
MDRKLIHLLTFILFISLSPKTVFADWYILLPPDKRPGGAQTEEKKIEQKLNKQPYKTEKSKIPAPDFKFRTINKIFTPESLKGKKVILFFFENPYSPETEELIKTLDRIASQKDVVILCVDTNDADFSILEKYKKDMNLKNLFLTADSFLLKKFKEQVKIKKLPASIFIDKNGFIRFYADRINSKDIKEFETNIVKILKKL